MTIALFHKSSCAVLLGAWLSLGAQTATQAPTEPPPAAKMETTAPPPLPQAAPKEQAWHLLRSGVRSQKIEQRATAVRALSLLRGQREAVAMATKALADEHPKVRIAAATALGELRATSAIPKLKEALSDKEITVVLAAAQALLLMKDPSAYEVYYAILTGERKSGKGLIAGQLDTLKDPKKMAMLGVQEGIGFIPFAGIGYEAIRTIMKNDSSPVRAAAARVLAQDPDPATTDGLVDVALDDKSELVRTAALEAVARHDDPAYISKIAPAMADTKDLVRYTAAAAVARLTALGGRRRANQK
jgi:HEAT repeat protein